MSFYSWHTCIYTIRMLTESNGSTIDPIQIKIEAHAAKGNTQAVFLFILPSDPKRGHLHCSFV